ncbi:DUF6095 family protein [Lacinutrix sp. 5H-3-7-4]|uniref:DUF6095 family protein n=1 Tax=Lacinutrix sp. (strain 5H-3-7-4) TaxID=983544 RepID=UPI00020A3D6C|nr:DUF6095 family protein [Lacinutrix sp. 5H-3-7-4]AEG99883.1 hypothetical protein Lacal_0031 [Lacinutrix sp. 5H-3-7-4]
METKSTDKNILVKGLKKMGISIAFMFLGPTVLYIAFSNQEKILYIPLIVIGVLFCISAIYFAFKGLNTILDSMFKSKKTR